MSPFPVFVVMLVFTLVISGIDSSESGCTNPDHIPYGDHCYWFVLDRIYTWDQANEKCKENGMELVSIHSEDENNFLLSHENDRSWIGLLRVDDGVFFRWTDGSCFDWANWQENEPNNDDEGCGEVREDGEWNDISCTKDTDGFICKIPKDTDSSTLAASKSLSGGAVAGIVICATLIAVVLAIAVFLTATDRWSLVTGRFK